MAGTACHAEVLLDGGNTVLPLHEDFATWEPGCEEYEAGRFPRSEADRGVAPSVDVCWRYAMQVSELSHGGSSPAPVCAARQYSAACVSRTQWVEVATKSAMRARAAGFEARLANNFKAYKETSPAFRSLHSLQSEHGHQMQRLLEGHPRRDQVQLLVDTHTHQMSVAEQAAAVALQQFVVQQRHQYAAAIRGFCRKEQVVLPSPLRPAKPAPGAPQNSWLLLKQGSTVLKGVSSVGSKLVGGLGGFVGGNRPRSISDGAAAGDEAGHDAGQSWGTTDITAVQHSRLSLVVPATLPGSARLVRGLALDVTAHVMNVAAVVPLLNYVEAETPNPSDLADGASAASGDSNSPSSLGTSALNAMLGVAGSLTTGFAPKHQPGLPPPAQAQAAPGDCVGERADTMLRIVMDDIGAWIVPISIAELNRVSAERTAGKGRNPNLELAKDLVSIMPQHITDAARGTAELVFPSLLDGLAAALEARGAKTSTDSGALLVTQHSNMPWCQLLVVMLYNPAPSASPAGAGVRDDLLALLNRAVVLTQGASRVFLDTTRLAGLGLPKHCTESLLRARAHFSLAASPVAAAAWPLHPSASLREGIASPYVTPPFEKGNGWKGASLVSQALPVDDATATSLHFVLSASQLSSAADVRNGLFASFSPTVIAPPQRRASLSLPNPSASVR